MKTNMESKSMREEAEQAAAAWLLRRSDVRWSEVDQTEFDRWLAAAVSHRVAFIRLEAMWDDADRLRGIAAGLPKGQVPPRGAIEQSPFFTLKQADTESDEPVRATLSEHFQRSTVKRTRRRFFAAAAGALFVVASGAAIYSGLAGRGTLYSTSVGGLSTIPMQDGSIITLNTNSEVQVRLTSRERRIDLKKGEAFFDVAKDPNRPFAVYIRDRRVVAVGTKFSVRLDSATVRVAVTEGKVRLEERASIFDLTNLTSVEKARQPDLAVAGAVVANKDGLIAGTIAEIDKGRIEFTQQPVPKIERALSWRSGYIAFDGTPLAEAIAEFNRYSDRQLQLDDDSLAMLKIEGNFRSNNVEGFVRLLEQGFRIKAAQEGGRILLSRKT